MRLLISFFTIFLFLSSVLPVDAQQKYDYDVAASVGSISFVPPQIKAGEALRIYGTIVNVGNNDLTGFVGFYQGTMLIGEPQPFSLKANGVPEEIWVDWIPPEGTYNIMMTIIQTKPDDQNPSNNVSVTPMLTVRKPSPPVGQAVQPSAAASPLPSSQSVSQPPVQNIKNESVAAPSAAASKPAVSQDQKSKTITPPSVPTPITGRSKPTALAAVPEGRVAAMDGTSTEVTNASSGAPIFMQYSEELKKAVEKQSEYTVIEASSAETGVPDNQFAKEENTTNNFLIIGSSIAVTFLLVGLIFLKRSGIV